MAMITPVTQLTMVVNPFAARALLDDPGWDRTTFRHEIFERARVVRERLATVLPLTGGLDQWFADADSFVVVVAGGAHFPTVCSLLSGWLMGGSWAVTKPIRDPASTD
jgi:hypothetical protein